jgi:peptidoglycan/LPS O-acetylase OafA/YrhL
METGTQRVHFKNLDILRFIAAYMIVLLHCFFGWKAFFGHPEIITLNTTPTILNKIEILMHNFSFGVDIFFLISGFLITYLLLVENERTGKVDIIKFYIRRAYRIWPLYFLLILIAPLLTYFFNEQKPDYLYQFLFAGNFDIINQGPKSPATDHLWSICIEEQFYLFCPLLVTLIPIRKLPQVLLGIVLACIFFRIYISTTTEIYGMTIYMHTLSRIDVLALGSLFGYLFFHNKIKFDHSWPVRLIIYCIFLTVFLNVDYNECGSFFSVSVKKYFFILMIAYWAGNFLFNPGSVIRFGKTGALHYLGKVSYGIYMFNPVVIFLILKLCSEFSIQNYPLYLLMVHAGLLFTVFLSYRFIELPFLNLKEKYAVVKSGAAVKPETEVINEADPQNLNVASQALFNVLKK